MTHLWNSYGTETSDVIGTSSSRAFEAPAQFGVLPVIKMMLGLEDLQNTKVYFRFLHLPCSNLSPLVTGEPSPFSTALSGNLI